MNKFMRSDSDESAMNFATHTTTLKELLIRFKKAVPTRELPRIPLPRTPVGMEGNEHGRDVQSCLEPSPLERLVPPLSAQLGSVAAVVLDCSPLSST